MCASGGAGGSARSARAGRPNAGPLAPFVSSGSSSGQAQPALEREGDQNHKDAERAGEFWKESHELLANVMLVLVVLHVAGVLLASYVHRENLTRAMVNGRKRSLSE